MIEVVSAIITRGDRIFLQQRRESRDYPSTWECPGGKVEMFDQTPREALERELVEEIGWIKMRGAISETVFFATTFEPPETKYDLHISFFHADPDFYDVSSPALRPRENDAMGYGWFTLREASVLTLTPANVRLVKYMNDDVMRRVKQTR